jgi:hypothetical protein
MRWSAVADSATPLWPKIAPQAERDRLAPEAEARKALLDELRKIEAVLSKPSPQPATASSELDNDGTAANASRATP